MARPTPAALPETIEGLRALVFLQQSEVETRAAQNQVLAKTLDEYKTENDRLAEYVRLLKSKRFGPSSERSHGATQPGLFNEAEALADQDEEGAGSEDESDGCVMLMCTMRFTPARVAARINVLVLSMARTNEVDSRAKRTSERCGIESL